LFGPPQWLLSLVARLVVAAAAAAAAAAAVINGIARSCWLFAAACAVVQRLSSLAPQIAHTRTWPKLWKSIPATPWDTSSLCVSAPAPTSALACVCPLLARRITPCWCVVGLCDGTDIPTVPRAATHHHRTTAISTGQATDQAWSLRRSRAFTRACAQTGTKQRQGQGRAATRAEVRQGAAGPSDWVGRRARARTHAHTHTFTRNTETHIDTHTYTHSDIHTLTHSLTLASRRHTHPSRGGADTCLRWRSALPFCSGTVSFHCPCAGSCSQNHDAFGLGPSSLLVAVMSHSARPLPLSPCGSQPFCQLQEATNAVQRRDFATAEVKYNEAVEVATSSAELYLQKVGVTWLSERATDGVLTRLRDAAQWRAWEGERRGRRKAFCLSCTTWTLR
jgi:hypothetical protein